MENNEITPTESLATTVKDVLTKINNKEEVNPKVLAAFLSLRHCTIPSEGFDSKLEYCQTLREWLNIEDKAANDLTDEEFLSIFPHLQSYV